MILQQFSEQPIIAANLEWSGADQLTPSSRQSRTSTIHKHITISTNRQTNEQPRANKGYRFAQRRMRRGQLAWLDMAGALGLGVCLGRKGSNFMPKCIGGTVRWEHEQTFFSIHASLTLPASSVSGRSTVQAKSLTRRVESLVHFFSLLHCFERDQDYLDLHGECEIVWPVIWKTQRQRAFKIENRHQSVGCVSKYGSGFEFEGIRHEYEPVRGFGKNLNAKDSKRISVCVCCSRVLSHLSSSKAVSPQ